MSVIEKYVQNKTLRLNTSFRIVNGVGFYELNGKILSESQFNRKYPLRLILSDKVDLDPRRAWMKGFGLSY